MKLNKAMLIKAARDAIQRQKDAQVEWDKNIELAKEEHERVWREEVLPKWVDFADRIKKGARNGIHITRDMMPTKTDRYSENHFYKPFNVGSFRHSQWQDATHKLGPRPIYQVRNLENLLDFLATVEDETVTVASLERVGFRNLANLMDAVRNGHWDVS